MDSAKYRNLFQYLKRFIRKALQKFAKKFEYDSKLESLFYVAKKKDGTALRRLVITEEEKARVFEECHSAPFCGHAGRDNTLRKIKERFYWPDYYKDTMEMVSYKFYLFANAPSWPWFVKGPKAQCDKLFYVAVFAFKIKVSIILKKVQWNYKLTEQNWRVCELSTLS